MRADTNIPFKLGYKSDKAIPADNQKSVPQNATWTIYPRPIENNVKHGRRRIQDHI
ncbi:hypothetical protein [uncultured Methanobacterium sp.]|uniref:hypothetical protein n=1 Tax=uncultured Methanobacterium sp. TaxID=176306 RepID=UPI002AA634D7|nr:hypothetical protein [uncultured Methanobacterium sp.]